MRNLLYKNLSCPKRGRKIITSAETADKEGVHSVVRRHFAYIVKPITSPEVNKPEPYLYVLKQRNTLLKREHFFCKVKGSVLAQNEGKFYLIIFVHTLNVELTASVKLSEQIG